MKFLTPSPERSEDHWMSVADLMSGLMMIFLFSAVCYMLQITNEKEKIRNIAVTYSRLQNDLFDDLNSEFEADLKRWNAVVDRQTLAVRFEAPEVLFQTGSAALSPLFKDILSDFFPRYTAILTSVKYSADIEEVRIEGHTSSEWLTDASEDLAYFRNMALSQDRTRGVLEYVFMLPGVANSKEWLRRSLTANGLSSSRLVFKDGTEEKEQSRRVEFRVRTNADQRVVRILEEET